MQELLSRLDPTIAIILIVAGVLALVIVVILTRRLRRRQSTPDETMGASPGLSGPVDYTSLPLDEEPRGWRDRFANLSLAGKILAVLVPILAILGILVLVLTLLPGRDQAPTALLPTTEPISLTVTKADVIRVDPEVTVSVAAETTGLSDGAEVTLELLADGQPLPFLRPDEARGTVRRGRVEILARRLAEAPAAQSGVAYSVRVSTADGQASGDMELSVPSIYSAGFYGTAAAAPEPTATPEAPTAAPEPTAAPTEAPAEPTAEPTAQATGPEVTVGNGGNVRALPIVTADNRVGGVDAGNTVQLLERTPNGQWYRIRFTDPADSAQKEGWISASLLSLSAEAQAQIPVATIVTVFTNGAVYDRPDSASTEIDRVNVDEVVSLKQKTAAGDWYQIDNVRGVSGWVPAELLGIPEDVAAKVPVAP